MIHLVRAIYLIVVLAFTVSFAFRPTVYRQGINYVTLYLTIPALLAFAVVMLDMFWRRKRLQALSGLFFGLLAGLVIAYVLAQIVGLVGNVFVAEARPDEAEARHVLADARLQADRIVRQASERAATITAAPTQPAAPDGTPPAARSPYRALERQTPPEEFGPAAAAPPVLELVKVLLGASAVFMCVSFVMQTKDDFRFVIPYVEFSKQTKGARPILLDTSVIIDGRIADITDTRILESNLVVPRFILAELQTIADSDEKLRRNRGRRGLDVLRRLQSSDKADIQILDTHVRSVEETPEVDAKLVALAQHLDGRIVTNDYNLNKIAQLRGVDVININDLANALKPVVLPGETMSVKIIKPGEEAGQGVGYLEDGTMVVAEQGRDYINREITIVVTSVLQTSAGKMIFGRLSPDKLPGPSSKLT